MSNYIKKTKDGANYNPEVHAPIRRVSDDMTFDQMKRAEVTNVQNKFKSSSILSMLDGANRYYSDIEGVTVKMIAKIHDTVYTDTVIVRGDMGNFYIVEIDGEKYSVSKNCVVFAIA